VKKIRRNRITQQASLSLDKKMNTAERTHTHTYPPSPQHKTKERKGKENKNHYSMPLKIGKSQPQGTRKRQGLLSKNKRAQKQREDRIANRERTTYRKEREKNHKQIEFEKSIRSSRRFPIADVLRIPPSR
jgi:hypothetical protein